MYTGHSLQNKILNLPPHEEEKMKSNLCRHIITERQRDGHFNVDSMSEDSDCPDDFEGRKMFVRDKIIFSPDALSGKNMMYVWEDPDSRIHVSDLAIIVMGLLEDGLAREKAKASYEADKKKKELQARRATPATNSIYSPSPTIKTTNKTDKL
jgi:hypothetical protein